jgi:hypothetical protein
MHTAQSAATQVERGVALNKTRLESVKSKFIDAKGPREKSTLIGPMLCIDNEDALNSRFADDHGMI